MTVPDLMAEPHADEQPPDLAIAVAGGAGLVVVALCRPRLHQRKQARQVDLQE